MQFIFFKVANTVFSGNRAFVSDSHTIAFLVLNIPFICSCT